MDSTNNSPVENLDNNENILVNNIENIIKVIANYRKTNKTTKRFDECFKYCVFEMRNMLYIRNEIEEKKDKNNFSLTDNDKLNEQNIGYTFTKHVLQPNKQREETPDSQCKLMKYCPASGEEKPYPSQAQQWRDYHLKVAWLFNPWTGDKRSASEIGIDPFGYLIGGESF